MKLLPNAASILPPAAFTACVHQAAREAVAAAAPKKKPTRAVLLAVIALLALVSLAALGGLFVEDLFSRDQGFMLPNVVWGSAPDESLPTEIVLIGYAGEITYQYADGHLVSADITFLSPNTPLLPASLLTQLSHECTRLFGPADQKTAIDGPALQQALREYLGYTDKTSEEERLAEALKAAGAEETRIARVQSSQDTAAEYLMDTWLDEKTHTALSLFASYAADGESLRKIRLSLGYLPEM